MPEHCPLFRSETLDHGGLLVRLDERTETMVRELVEVKTLLKSQNARIRALENTRNLLAGAVALVVGERGISALPGIINAWLK